MTDNLQKIRSACVAANPEIVNQLCHHRLMADESGCPFGEHSRPIRLADVLLAISEVEKSTYIDENESVWAIDVAGEFFGQSSSDGSPIYHDVSWNLRCDSLEEQPPETIAFLASLLTSK